MAPFLGRPKPAPIEVLHAALPGLGFTLSDDTEKIYDSLYNDTRRILGRIPTRGEMRAIVTAWIAWAGQHEAGSMQKSQARNRAALDAYHQQQQAGPMKVECFGKFRESVGSADSGARQMEAVNAMDDDTMCIYCSVRPKSVKNDPYCSNECAIDAQMNEGVIHTYYRCNNPKCDYKGNLTADRGKCPGCGKMKVEVISEDYTGAPGYTVGKSPMTVERAGVVGIPQSVLRDAAKRYGKVFKEGEPTQSAGSLFGGPTGSIGESEMQYDNSGRINKNASYKVTTAQGTTLAKGLSKDDAKNQCKNYHDATGKMAYYSTEETMPSPLHPLPVSAKTHPYDRELGEAETSIYCRNCGEEKEAGIKAKYCNKCAREIAMSESADITKTSNTYFGVTKESEVGGGVQTSAGLKTFTNFTEGDSSLPMCDNCGHELSPAEARAGYCESCDHKIEGRDVPMEAGVAPVYEDETPRPSNWTKATGTKPGERKPVREQRRIPMLSYREMTEPGKVVYEDDLPQKFDPSKRKVVNGITYYQVYNGAGQPVWCTVPPRPQDEDTDGVMSSSGLHEEDAKAPTRNKFFSMLIEKHRDLPVRYRDVRDTLVAECTDKMTLHTIAIFAHEQGLRTKMEPSPYGEWDTTWLLTVTGFKK